MQQRKYGCVAFNKKTKEFDGGDGNMVDELLQAEIFSNNIIPNEFLKRYDEPEEFELWPIEIVYRTCAY